MAYHRTSILDSPDSKLQILAQVIKKFSMSTHIDVLKDYKLRNSLTRFRLSAHNLPIETMRYLNVPRNLRLCPLCCEAVGDEIHYFLDCQYSDIVQSREKMLMSSNQFTCENDMLSLLRHNEPIVLCAIAKHVRVIERTLKT